MGAGGRKFHAGDTAVKEMTTIERRRERDRQMREQERKTRYYYQMPSDVFLETAGVKRVVHMVQSGF